MNWGNILKFAAPVVGKLLGGGAKGMEQGRQAQDTANVSRDRTALDAIGQRERAMMERRRLDMDQRDQDMKTRDDGYKQTLRAQYLQGWTPAQRPERIKMVSGGFNTVPQSSKDMAAKFEQEAMMRALNGQKFDALPAQERFTPTPIKQPSLWERISGVAGLGLTAAGAIKSAMGANAQGDDDDFMGPK